jgi:hypothetical protein
MQPSWNKLAAPPDARFHTGRNFERPFEFSARRSTPSHNEVDDLLTRDSRRIQ